jgi:hypothetical protein
MLIIRLAAKPPRRRCPLSSNVRPHAKCKTAFGELRVAHQGQRTLEPIASAQRFASSLVFAVLEAAHQRAARSEARSGERMNRTQVSRCQSTRLRPPVRWRAAHHGLFLNKSNTSSPVPQSGTQAN